MNTLLCGLLHLVLGNWNWNWEAEILGTELFLLHSGGDGRR